MPALHKSYKVNALQRRENPTFTIEEYNETFTCVAEAPGGLMATLVAGVDVDAKGNEIYRATNVNRFLEMVILEEREVPAPIEPGDEVDPVDEHAVAVRANTATAMVMEPVDDLQRWRLLMADKNRPVPLWLLVDIVMDLSAHYTERPTEPSRR